MADQRRDEEIEMARLLDESDGKHEDSDLKSPQDDSLEAEIDAFIAEDELGHRTSTYREPRRYSKLDISSRTSLPTGRYIILAVNFVVSLGIAISSTTALDMQKKLVCSNWYAIYSPGSTIPVDEKDPLCQTPEVKTWFSGLLVYVSLFDAFGGMIIYTLVGKLAGVYGRKPLLIVSFIGSTITIVLLPLSWAANHRWLERAILFVWMTFGSVANMRAVLLLMSMYIVDTTDAKSRTFWLNYHHGLRSLGSAPSFTIGGLITTKSHHPVTVYYITTTTMIACTLAIAFLVPESFGPEQREKLRKENLEKERGRHARYGYAKTRTGRIIDTCMAPLRLVRHLLPEPRADGRGKNPRLFIIAISLLIASIVSGYNVTNVIVYANTSFGFDAEKNGYMMTILSTVSLLWLLLISPPLLKLMERFYKPPTKYLALQAENDEEQEPDPVRAKKIQDEIKASIGDRRDIHVVVGSYIIEAVSGILIALAQTGTQLIAALSVMPLGGSGGAAMRSALTASASHIRSGEILSAIEVVLSVGHFLAPLQGVLFTALINTFPQVVFYIGSVIHVLAAAVMLLVREEDRYHEM